MLTIYHNPRCSKSRQTLALLEASGQPFRTHLYLEEAVPAEILTKAWRQFGPAMLRSGEPDFKTALAGKELTEKTVLAALQAYPKILERPLVVNGAKMALGRPPESVLEIL